MPTASPPQATQEPKPDLSARPVSIPEVLAMLQGEQERREEMSYEQKLALEHATTFARMPAEKARELRDALKATSPRVTDFHAIKIIDVAPTHPDDVRAVFARDRQPLEKEDIDKIIELVRSYL